MAAFAESIARTRQGILLGAGFAILVALGGAIVWLVNQAATDAEIVAQTLTVQNELSDVLLNARRAEAAQRGYLFTQDDVYLNDFNATRPEAARTLGNLRDLVKSDRQASAVVARIDELMAAKFAEMNRTIELNRSGQRAAARAVVQSGGGRDLQNDLRELVEREIAREVKVQAERAAASSRNNRLLLVISLVGAVMVILIGALSIYLVQRNSRQRELAQAELASNNANLERIVEFRTADLQDANEEIQRFAYIVSHDLRSPLVNIMGFTTELEALRKDIFDRVAQLQKDIAELQPSAETADPATVENLGKDFDEAIGIIKTSIARMDRLINAVLKLSREGRRQFNPEQIDMAEVMDAIAASVAHRAAETGTRLEIANISPVESDRIAIEQIFSNLIDNALKYGRTDGSGRIDVVGRETATQVVYEVRDNGRGIDPKDHQRIFELFRRSGTQDRPGEGIGLAHVRALVRRIGGHIGVSSELGKGSQFTVTLPRRWTLDRRSAA
jgi:signal transduction histidine kinase